MLVPRVRLYRRGMTIPEQYKQAVIPRIMIDGAAEAITFYTAAFDASEHLRLDGDGGRILHAEIGIHGSTLMLSDPSAPFGPPGADGASVALHVHVPDVNALTAQAVAARRQPALGAGRHVLRSASGNAPRPLRACLDLPDADRRR
jgi:PhnB protein